MFKPSFYAVNLTLAAFVLVLFTMSEHDCASLIVGGAVIAVRNKEKKSAVLFPRGNPFYSRLSGTVSATPGKNLVKTSDDLTTEIMRGEAICIGGEGSGSDSTGYWFRVATAVGSGAAAQQSDRSKAPPSVTSYERVLADRNVYHDAFTSDTSSYNETCP